MTRLAGSFASLILAMLVVGCTTGNTDGDHNTLGRVCTATFTAQGSFMPGMAAPTGWAGCWPVGMWTFSVTQTASDCATAPMPLAQYQMKGDQVLDMNGDPNYAMSYVTDPSAHSIVKVSEGGAASQCEGELDLYSEDGKAVFYWKPVINSGNSIGGSGEFTLYTSDQWTGLLGG